MTKLEKLTKVTLQSLISIVIIILGLIPTWLFLIAKTLLNPNGFWQNLAVYGLGFYFLAAVQFMLLLVMVFLLFLTWIVLWENGFYFRKYSKKQIERYKETTGNAFDL